ncbi:F-box protein At5g07610-like [Lolium rigidum]|uniref:F-box protein At5g07610-like n=1 Tax=Lolium rigidum TaxID=89674 RepID=UPI001F5D2826|nr:F-box protein At5g07610-like [Lolium rigidum]
MRCFASIFGQQIDPSLDFMPQDYEFELVDSCMGLLLCRCNKTPSSSDVFNYVVCNPATKSWLDLPPSPTSRRTAICMARLGFDPAVSPEFYVFEFLDMGEVLEVSGVNIFSSAMTSWTYQNSGWDKVIGLQIDSRSIFIHGRIHLITQLSELVSVDTRGESWTVFSNLTVEFIGLSQGHLHCVTANTADVAVLCLEEYDTKTWVSKLHLAKGQLSENSAENWKIIGIHPDFDFLYLASIDDSKIASYSIKFHELKHIVDLDEGAQGQYFSYVPIFSENLQDLECRHSIDGSICRNTSETIRSA